MVPDDAPASNGMESDLAVRTRSGGALASVARDSIQSDASTVGGSVSQGQRRSRGSIPLVAVMGLDDLQIGVGERGSRPLHQIEQEIHTEREIGRLKDRSPLCMRIERVRDIGRQTCGSRDERTIAEVGERGAEPIEKAEVDHAGRIAETPGSDRSTPAHRSGELEVVGFFDEATHQAPHPAGCAQDRDLHARTTSSSSLGVGSVAVIKGRRTSARHSPSWAIAALQGTGFESSNR